MQSPLEPHNEEEDKATPLGRGQENLVEESLHKGFKYEMPRYDIPSYFFKYHISWKPSEIPFTSYHGSDFVIDSKYDQHVENDICVVDPCHKKDDLMC